MQYFLLVLDEAVNEYYLEDVFDSVDAIPQSLLEFCTYFIIEGRKAK